MPGGHLKRPGEHSVIQHAPAPLPSRHPAAEDAPGPSKRKKSSDQVRGSERRVRILTRLLGAKHRPSFLGAQVSHRGFQLFPGHSLSQQHSSGYPAPPKPAFRNPLHKNESAPRQASEAQEFQVRKSTLDRRSDVGRSDASHASLSLSPGRTPTGTGRGATARSPRPPRRTSPRRPTPLREATSGDALRTSSNPGRPSSIPASKRDSLRPVGPPTIAVRPWAAQLPLTSSLRPGETDADPRTPRRHQRTLRPPAATAAACLTATSSLTRSKAGPTKRARGRTRPAPRGASTDRRERRPGTGRATIAARTADFPTTPGDTLRSSLRPAPPRRRSSLPICSRKERRRRPRSPAPPLCSTRRRRGRSTTPPK